MKRLLTPANLRLAIEIILVIVAVAFTMSRSMPTEAASASAPAAPDAQYWYQCNSPSVEHVAVFTDRIHVWCQTTTPANGGPALTGISWFAFPTSPDSAEASRFLSLFQTSAISGRYVWLELNPTDTSGTSFGCGASDCRRIVGAELR
jgi:hypothetical protein